MKRIIPIIFLILVNLNLVAQEDKVVWDIGTKWYYEFNWSWNANDTFDYVLIEIVDTTTIDKLKLYKAERVHSTCSSTFYLHYDGNKVYNYQPNLKLLQLLYEFGNSTDYITQYNIQCDFNNELDSSIVDLPIRLDSTSNYMMPDGTHRKVQHLTAIDTFRSDSTLFMNHNRTVIDGIGFLNGHGFVTHEWYIDGYFCDQWTCFAKYLRCFQNDSVSYNFVGFPCDSIYTLGLDELHINKLEVFPNPTSGILSLKSELKIERIRISNLKGDLLIDREHEAKEIIELPNSGVYILNAKIGDVWVNKRIICIK
jgi:hypothetical protein